MNLHAFTLPDLPMPEPRVQARRQALVQEITRKARARRRPAVWKLAVPVAATALVAGLAVANLTTGQVVPMASWTAVPTPLNAADAAAAGSGCQAELDQQHWPIAVTRMPTALAERRGQFKAVLLTGDSQYGMCVTGPHGRIFVGVGDVSTFTPADGLVLDGEPGQLNGGWPFRIVYGQAAPEVSDVHINVTDGRQVTATLGNGRFVAWWPSGADPATITASASDGHVVKVVHPTPTSPSQGPVRRSTPR